MGYMGCSKVLRQPSALHFRVWGLGFRLHPEVSESREVHRIGLRVKSGLRDTKFWGIWMRSSGSLLKSLI